MYSKAHIRDTFRLAHYGTHITVFTGDELRRGERPSACACIEFSNDNDKFQLEEISDQSKENSISSFRLSRKIYVDLDFYASFHR